MNEATASLAPEAETAVPPETLPTTGAADDVTEQPTEKQEPYKLPAGVERRLGRLTEQKYQARARAEAAQARAAELEARLAVYERPQESPQAQSQGQTPEDVVALAERIAEAKLAHRSMAEWSTNMIDSGRKAFGAEKFDAACNDLADILVDDKQRPTALLDAIRTCDEPHRIIAHMADHPDEADSIARLSPLAQARAMAKLEAKLEAAPAPPAVSKAPPPVRPVGQRSSATDKLSDQDDIKTWMAKRAAQAKG